MSRVSRIAWSFLKGRIPQRVRTSVELLLRRDQPGRDLEVFPDDVFIVSYPKSGNTWVRFLIASLIGDDPADFVTMETRVPTIYKSTTHDLAALPRPRVLKSHEYFDPRYRRVVYVVRDPRDVLVSYYHYSLRKGFIEDSYSLEAFGDDFIHGRRDPFHFGTWYENVASWLGAREHSSEFVLLRYEDLRRDTIGQLASIARLLGSGTDEPTLRRAVEASSFERMKSLERLSNGETVHLENKRPDIPFVRRGVAGGWREELPERVRLALESAWSPLMRRLRYLDDAVEARPTSGAH